MFAILNGVFQRRLCSISNAMYILTVHQVQAVTKYKNKYPVHWMIVSYNILQKRLVECLCIAKLNITVVVFLLFYVNK